MHECYACRAKAANLKALRAHFAEHPECGDEIEYRRLLRMEQHQGVSPEELDHLQGFANPKAQKKALVEFDQQHGW